MSAKDSGKKSDHKAVKKSHQGGGNNMLTVVAMIIAVVAIRRQLRLPKDERTWHGTVEVPVPFEFRRPSVDRLRDSVWNPADDRLFVPMAFGVGWSVNVARLLRRRG